MSKPTTGAFVIPDAFNINTAGPATGSAIASATSLNLTAEEIAAQDPELQRYLDSDDEEPATTPAPTATPASKH
ncbi:hypothetical protein Pelo_16796 [Pelomyxa schiedti]|nr:hypothetical protein Pelo_16796 [Pelomyxa schiedti]